MEVCRRFYVSRRVFYNWRKEYNALLEKNDVNVDEYQHNKKITKRISKKSKFGNELMMFIKDYTINRDNFRMKNLIREIKDKYGKTLNPNNIYYILRKQGVTFKKAKHRTIKKPIEYEQKVQKLINDVNNVGPNNIISIDECHFETNMSPNYGWSKNGERTIFVKKSSRRDRVTLILAISSEKIIYHQMYTETVDSKTFLQFIKSLNKKCRNKTYLMDNARIHKAKIINEHMEGLSNKILYNVPYSPETNPIEQSFSKIKSTVIREDTETIPRLKNTIINTINDISTNDLSNFFKHSFG
jgi:transposase